MIIAVVLLNASLLAKAIRWRLLLRGRMGALDTLRIFYVAVLINNIVPLRLGDATRVLSAPVKRLATAQQAIVTLVAERLVDATFLGVVALVAVPFYATGVSVSVEPRWTWAASVGAGGVSVVCLACARAPAARLRVAAWLRSDWLRTLVSDATAATPPGATQRLELLGLTLVAWLGAFLLHYVLLLAVGGPDSFVLAIAVTLATNLAMLVPAAPANLGTFHAAAAAPLLAVNVPGEVAVAYALLAHLLNTVPPSLVGAAFIGPSLLRTAQRWATRSL